MPRPATNSSIAGANSNSGTDANNAIYASNAICAICASDASDAIGICASRSFRRRLRGLVLPGSVQLAPRQVGPPLVPRSRHWRRSRHRRSRPQRPLFSKASLFPPSSRYLRAGKSPPADCPIFAAPYDNDVRLGLARGGLGNIDAAEPLPRPTGRNIAHDIIPGLRRGFDSLHPLQLVGTKPRPTKVAGSRFQLDFLRAF